MKSRKFTPLVSKDLKIQPTAPDTHPLTPQLLAMVKILARQAAEEVHLEEFGDKAIFDRYVYPSAKP